MGSDLIVFSFYLLGTDNQLSITEVLGIFVLDVLNVGLFRHGLD